MYVLCLWWRWCSEQMQKMVAEIKSATAQSTAAGTKQNRYEYDSDEDTDGGTWEHKTRLKEMRTSEGTYSIDGQ